VDIAVSLARSTMHSTTRSSTPMQLRFQAFSKLLTHSSLSLSLSYIQRTSGSNSELAVSF